MILALHSAGTVVHIDITADRFIRLRDPSVTSEEITAIAAECGVDAGILIRYAADLLKSVRENHELDASCDYSDHL